MAGGAIHALRSSGQGLRRFACRDLAARGTRSPQRPALSGGAFGDISHSRLAILADWLRGELDAELAPWSHCDFISQRSAGAHAVVFRFELRGYAGNFLSLAVVAVAGERQADRRGFLAKALAAALGPR